VTGFVRRGREQDTAHRSPRRDRARFRSSFRVWCEEQTNFPRSVTEAALAHTNKDKVEAAYQRSDLFERRRDLMAQWASYCTNGGKVIRLEHVA